MMTRKIVEWCPRDSTKNHGEPSTRLIYGINRLTGKRNKIQNYFNGTISNAREEKKGGLHPVGDK